ncbi:unnamed protein product [Lymnaea stagnalis]|uniref:VWFC domain-containing protein n=1 Tax=Lymnaea stagnalis TaxID=6523 RepID=A0AAV2I675_LYMST
MIDLSLKKIILMIEFHQGQLLSDLMTKFIVACLLVVASIVTMECCHYRGVNYSPGQRYQKNPCTSCYCDENNKAICNTIQCGWPHCKNKAHPVTKPGNCCPSCPAV